ncbi:uncharacterized protein METZ01_LOCUS178141 [marine metagenome]|uniref:Uncharacterized protein n=1 Tax=marine metagenome TaxID=408172 RepID=A0A382CIZ4_9ZZZZ
MAEHRTFNPQVVGSSPTPGAEYLVYVLKVFTLLKVVQGRISMSDEVKGRGQIGELIAQVFERYENEKLKRKGDFQEHDPFIQT